jgi:hypothetical protein
MYFFIYCAGTSCPMSLTEFPRTASIKDAWKMYRVLRTSVRREHEERESTSALQGNSSYQPQLAFPMLADPSKKSGSNLYIPV